MYQVFFYEAFEEEQKALQRCLPPSLKAGFSWQTIQETGHTNPPAPLISIRTQSVIPKTWAPNLSGVLTRSTGYDHVAAYKAACRPHLPAGYLPLYCNRAVAEQAMLLWMALLRKLPLQMIQFRTFTRDGITGRECKGKTLVVVGVGNIGTEIVRIGHGLEMKVYGVDIVKRLRFVEYLQFEEVAPLADVVVCAMNLTKENRGFFNLKRLEMLKKGCFFVNIARGELAPSKDLFAALENGHLGGVGLDVYEDEPHLAVALRGGKEILDRQIQQSEAMRATVRLMQRNDVILLPHNAFNTLEAVERKAQQSIESISYFLASGAFPYPVS